MLRNEAEDFILIRRYCTRRYYINDTYARVCVPNKVKSMNVKVFKLVSGVYEKRFIVQHESCKYKCRLNENGCNSK